MQLLRALLFRNRAVVLLVIVAALCMKLLVPAGYMIDHADGSVTVRICGDGLSPAMTRQLAIPMKHGDASGAPAGDMASKGDCAYTSLSMGILTAADPALLAAALAFILLLGFAPISAPRPPRATYLRPPLRGPPALI